MRFYLLLLSLTVIALNFCCSDSPLDTYSTVGEDLLRSHDSTLTDFGRNFRTLSTKLKVLQRINFTDLDTADATAHPAVHGVGDSLTLGRWLNQQSTTYAEFNGDSLVAKLRMLKDSGFAITGVYLDIAKGAMPGQLAATVRHIPVRSHTEPLLDTAKSATDVGVLLNGPTWMTYQCTPFVTDSLLTTKDQIAEVDTVDTIFHSTNGTITDTEIIYDTTFANLALAIGYAGDLIRLPATSEYKPRLHIIFNNASAGIDTLTQTASYLDYTVIDADTSHAVAKTSGSTGCIGVVAVDLAPVWNALEDSSDALYFEHILKAQLTLDVDSAASIGSTLSFRYLLLDSLLTDTVFNARKNASLAKTLPTDTLKGECLTDTTILLLKNINEYISTRPPIGYLYLLPATSDFQKIRWTKHALADSVSVEAVYSNPR